MECVKELLDILDRVETTDSGTEFHPTHFSSCRTMEIERFNKMMVRLRKLMKKYNGETNDTKKH